MFEFLIVVLCIWLLVKVTGLAFRLTWGAAKIVASILTVIALPVLFVCMVFVGGAALLIPLALLGIALGVVRICV